MDHFQPFAFGACDACGKCLEACPVMDFGPDEARREIHSLLTGQQTARLLRRCTACFVCDFACPHACRPTALIIQRWQEAIERSGLPRRAAYFLPLSTPNFRSYVVEHLPPDEGARVRAWGDTSRVEEILYPGCNWITQPFLAMTRLFEDLPIRGALELCCGETLYRSGLREAARRQGERVVAHFERLGVRRLIIPCAAGLNMFTRVLPGVFGIHPSFEVVHLLDWLAERLRSGRIPVVAPLEKTVTIQDSCYARLFGEDFLDRPRGVLTLLGAHIVEEELCRRQSLCCGIAAGFSPSSGYHPLDITLAALNSLNLARKTGARMVVTYCAGCLQMLALGRLIFPLAPEIVHIVELIQTASGETPARRASRRAARLLTGVARYQTPHLFSRARIRA